MSMPMPMPMPVPVPVNNLFGVLGARPKRLGGVAGGKKYLWRGILFKLADGSQGPYGGSDEAAAKAAGHELRGVSDSPPPVINYFWTAHAGN